MDDSDELLAPIREALGEKRPYSLAELATKLGLPRQIVAEIMGASDREEPYSKRDAAYGERVKHLLDTFPLPVLTRLARLRHRALSSIALADFSVVRDYLINPMLEDGATPQEVVADVQSFVKESAPAVAELVSLDYTHNLWRLSQLDAFRQGAFSAAGQVDLAVGFCDLVGYTSMSGTLDARAIGDLLTVFEDLVAEHGDRHDVQLVKFLGDAAMLVCERPDDLAALLLVVVEDRLRLGDTPRRAGMAYGHVLVRMGDFFGPTVNLASRLTDHAEPGSVLAARDLSERLDERFSVSDVPTMKLHNIGSYTPVRVRRMRR